VVAQVGDRPERDDPPRHRRLPAADARHAAVAAGDADEDGARGLGHLRVVGVADDRRERPVDVEQDRRARRVGAHWGERLGERGGGGHVVS
jgi:hypothetical protein